jgi:hypothetical protein
MSSVNDMCLDLDLVLQELSDRWKYEANVTHGRYVAGAYGPKVMGALVKLKYCWRGRALGDLVALSAAKSPKLPALQY